MYSAIGNTSKTKLLAFGVVFGSLGLATLLLSHASSVYVSVEPESSAVSMPATVGSDAAASGGKYVQFGSAISAGPCGPAVPLPTNDDPGTLVIADGFETGDFSKWTTVVREGDATAAVQSSLVKTGGCASKIHATANTGSRANIAKTLPAASREVWATGWFNITREGASTASNVPTFRFFNGTTRVLDVSRQNGGGVFFVRWPTASGDSWNNTGKTLTLNQWYQIKLHVVANGSQSQVTVWLDGTQVFARTSATTGYATFGSFTSLTSVQIGAEHYAQDGDFVTDDVVIKAVQ